MGAKLYTLTPEHRAQLAPWAARWAANALRTAPQTEEDRNAMRVAMRGMCAAANLDPVPEHRELFCPSPLAGAIAASVASGVWWLRENPAEQRKLFGRVFHETELMGAIGPACAMAVESGQRAVRMDPPKPPSTRAATDAATRAATDAATSAATGAATDAAPLVRFLVRCCAHWYRFHDGGNHYSAWCSYLSFFRAVAKLDLPEYDRWRHYEAAAIHGGPRFQHRKFWIVSDVPVVLTRDAQNRLHSDTGPACAWGDGWEIYSVHGVRMPAWVFETPEALTPARIDGETNAEVRRVMLERFGLARYMLESKAEVLHEDVDQLGHPRRLLRKPMGDGLPSLTMVHVKNSTLEPDGSRKDYVLAVHPQLRPIFEGRFGGPQGFSCHNAVASTFGLRGDQYRPEAET